MFNSPQTPAWSYISRSSHAENQSPDLNKESMHLSPGSMNSSPDREPFMPIQEKISKLEKEGLGDPIMKEEFLIGFKKQFGAEFKRLLTDACLDCEVKKLVYVKNMPISECTSTQISIESSFTCGNCSEQFEDMIEVELRFKIVIDKDDMNQVIAQIELRGFQTICPSCETVCIKDEDEYNLPEMFMEEVIEKLAYAVQIFKEKSELYAEEDSMFY